MKKRVLYICLCTVLGLNVLIGTQIYLQNVHAAEGENVYDEIRLFMRVLERVRQDYVDGQKVTYQELIRAAMKGMLPEEVLWPRLYKTGLTKDYLMRSVQEEFPKHAAALGRESALADLGVIDPSGLTRAVAESATDTRGWMAGHLYFTFQAEYWLRSRLSVADHLTPFDDVRGSHVPSREPLIA